MRLAFMTLIVASLTVLVAPELHAQPSVDQCMKMIEPAVPGEKGLECKFRGGERSTNEISGKKYLTPVAKCWDYDTVVMKSCNCRKFVKASICCRNGSKNECEWRVGNSEVVDCTQYGQPKYGISGNTESPECVAKRKTESCAYSKMTNPWFYPNVGTCYGDTTKGGVFECKTPDGEMDYAHGKCGPDLATCGCTLREDCSSPEWVACYKELLASPEGMACFDRSKEMPNHERVECYEKVKASGGKAKPAVAGSAAEAPAAEAAKPEPAPGKPDPAKLMKKARGFKVGF